MSMSPRHPVDPVDDRVDAATAPASPSRRRFVRNVGLGAAALGAVAATGTALTDVASAQTTSTPPELSASDTTLTQFLLSVSLTAHNVTVTAAGNDYLPSDVAETLNGFSRTHNQHAITLAGLLGATDVISDPNPKLLSEIQVKVDASRNTAALLDAAGTFEENLSATFLVAMGDAESWVLAGSVATMLPIIGQMAAAIGKLTGAPISDWLPPFGSTDGALSPAAYPAR
jgi:hypothetical protein